MARKEKTIHYIYKTTCNVTGKYYVGMHSTNNLEDGYLGSGKRLRYSIRKYGVENHTKQIVEYLPTREALVLRETEIVTKELISDGKCMNLKEGGTGGFSNEEHRIKCSKAGNAAKKIKLKNDLEYRQNYINKRLKNILESNALGKNDSLRFTGKSHSDETKQLMSEIKKGKKTGESNSQYGTCWITKDSINKKIKKEDLEIYLNDGWLKGRK